MKSVRKISRSFNNSLCQENITFAYTLLKQPFPAFTNVTIPVVALAGGKEQKEVHDSIKKMVGKIRIADMKSRIRQATIYRRFLRLMS